MLIILTKPKQICTGTFTNTLYLFLLVPLDRDVENYPSYKIHDGHDGPIHFVDVPVGAGNGQPVNGTIPSLPSPTMPTFNMAAQTPNGQPGGQEQVYTNGIPPQSYQARK